MGDGTSIGWTDATWPVINGCRRCSPGCENCYAERLIATRLSKTPKYQGLAVYKESGPRWTGESRLWAPHLDWPLRWRKPRKIFVADMGDLFFESVTNEEIAAVFGVMAACPQHQFQVLTKRPERMREWYKWVERQRAELVDGSHLRSVHAVDGEIGAHLAAWETCRRACAAATGRFGSQQRRFWPLHNVWIGVSVESQKYADERIPILLDTPAAIRFVSYEPALEAVDFSVYMPAWFCDACGHFMQGRGDAGAAVDEDEADPQCSKCYSLNVRHEGLSWVIVGGESGPKARPFNVEWARTVVRQCADAEVPCFVKQLGSVPMDTTENARLWPARTELWQRLPGSNLHQFILKDRKGDVPEEWPDGVRVQRFPRVRP